MSDSASRAAPEAHRAPPRSGRSARKGGEIHDPRAFTPGKIHRANRKILFIDELNRIPERTQNTLIEVLEEKVTTIAGFDINIPVDTIVIATQNPEEYAGADKRRQRRGAGIQRRSIMVDLPLWLLRRSLCLVRHQRLQRLHRPREG